jgi:hypothetical protein
MSNPGPKKIKTSAVPSPRTRSTIGSRHAETARLTYTEHEHVSTVATLVAQLDLADSGFYELVERDKEIRASEMPQLERAQQLAILARDDNALSARKAEQSATFEKYAEALAERAKTIEEEFKRSAEATISTGKISSSLQGVDHHLDEAREVMKGVVDINGPVQAIELATLRQTCDNAMEELELLRGERDALQSLLFHSISSRTSETAAIEGFAVQPLASHPLQKTPDVIVSGVKHLAAENQELRQQLVKSNRAHDDQAKELEVISGQQEQYKQQHDETRQLLEDIKSSTEDVRRQAVEYHVVNNLNQQLDRLELEKEQSLELVEKTKVEVKELRARLYWVEEDMIERSTNATRVHRKLLDVIKKEREQRANKVLEKTVLHGFKEEAARNERDLAVTRAATAEEIAKNAETRARELEKQMAMLNTQLETSQKLHDQELKNRDEEARQWKEAVTNSSADTLKLTQEAHAAELQSVQESSKRGLDELKKSGDVSKTSAEAFASRMADETLQNKVNAAEQIAAIADQKRIAAEENATTADQKRTAAEGKIEIAELRATAAEDMVKALRAQLRLSEEAKGIAQAGQTDAVQQAKSTVEEANKRIEGAERSRLLSEQIQQRLLFDANTADHQVGELKAKIGKQEEELAHLSRLRDELAKTKRDLDVYKRSRDDWKMGCGERDKAICSLQEDIDKLVAVIAERDALIKAAPRIFD